MTLAEKAKEAMAEAEAEKLTQKVKKGTLTLEDFQEQLQRVQQMGPLNQIMQLIPGMSSAKGRAALESMDESVLKRAEAIISSMTTEEKRNPDIIDGSRRRRIARGSGTTPQDINQLLKQYNEAKRLMQMVSSGRKLKIPAQWMGRM